ncbi:DUF2314 domain-containing protein [Hymenobacter lapidiphilus]|uniref:DUF2314 domain-containing protein n=1 Tax=Hymenobacter lapidiphilus TaxID=2608003 RepID=A0A7Y7PRL0_9BACT|nr:DUF2314 domain-containing protein [Hymenobacter lapidiphilus]NVO32630.1 DUF2314 domain-containing protein [Hymenobacter lapidiphilus]
MPTFRPSALLLILLPLALPLTVFGQAATAAAPTDKPRTVAGTDADQSLREFDKLIAPAVKQARRTLPAAKKRFLAGLPAGQAFYLTTRIFDADGKYEQVFIRVQEWTGATARGLISNELNLVQQYQPGQSISLPESAVLDWTITTADGREEGNFVGKLIDSLQN